MRKRILVVCMLDSIHSARWLKQFENDNYEFLIIPSKRHRRIHPLIVSLVKNQGSSRYRVKGTNFATMSPYFDFIRYEIVSRFIPFLSRRKNLERCLGEFNPSIVHAIEIQGAGYLVLDALSGQLFNFDLIVTNWGSDIFFFQNIPVDREKISSLLKIATHYSAECRRDYVLATELGFSGVELPLIPNSGGFAEEKLNEYQEDCSKRKLIVIKGYEGKFGRASIVMELLPKIFEKYAEFSVFIYSVTSDIEPIIKEIADEFPGRLKYSNVSDRLDHDSMLQLFAKARVYIGISVSDGISTSFLEALATGAYPIQTNTSCASEWTSLGAVASIVKLDLNLIMSALDEALSNDDLVASAQLANTKIAKENLSSGKVSEIAKRFYE